MALWASLTSSFYPISGAIHQPEREAAQSSVLRDDDCIAIREVKHGYLVMSDESGNIKLIETSHNRYRSLPEECKFKIKVQKTELLGITSLTDWRGRVCGFSIQRTSHWTSVNPWGAGATAGAGVLRGILGGIFGGPVGAAVAGSGFVSGSNLPQEIEVQCRFYDPAKFPGSAQHCTLKISKTDTGSMQGYPGEGVNLSFGTDEEKFHWQVKIDPPPMQAAVSPPCGRIYVERGSIIATRQQPNDSMIFRIEKIY